MMDQLKPLVNGPEWPFLKAYLEDLLDKSNRTIASQADLLLIGREQGKIEILRNLLRLRENVNGKRN